MTGSRRRPFPRRALIGVVAGTVATAVMSAQMIAEPSVVRIGTPPPQRIAAWLFAGEPPRHQRAAATIVHLAIGSVSGAVYRTLVARRRGGLVAGMLFGVAVWAVGYEVVMPALGLLPAAHRDRADRRAALLQAHLVYGATLGALAR